jgi:membrane-associated phospholipid phosphatase
MTDSRTPTLDAPNDPPDRIDLRGAAALVVVLLVGLAVLGLVVRGGALPIDMSLPQWIMAWYPPGATDLFDTLGTLPVFGAVMVAGGVISFRLHRPAMSAAFAVGLCAEIPAALVKLIVDRPRPPASTEIEAFITAASYPSGHTVRAVLMAGLIVAAVAWTRRPGPVRFVATIVGVAFVALVGLARIASGQHWPTDILGGLMLGVAWLAICLAVARTVADRSRVP